LQTDTSSLSIPSKLSNSTYLQAISTLTGNDLVGISASASSLGLAQSYTTTLFNFCPDEGTCSSFNFGFYFDPITDLHLDTTALKGTFSSSFFSTLSSYASTSTFLGIAYLLAFILTCASPVLQVYSHRMPRVAVISIITSTLATIFLLAASAASVAIFGKVKGTFNTSLTAAGITTVLGHRLFALSWVTTVLSFATSLLVCVQARRTAIDRRNKVINYNATTKGEYDSNIVSIPSNLPSLPTRRIGFFKRMPSWRRHKYEEIARQNAAKKTVAAYEPDIMMRRGFGGGEDEEDDEVELVRGSTRGGIQLSSMRYDPRRDLDTAYEPYRREAGISG